jgi:hypothetical protein
MYVATVVGFLVVSPPFLSETSTRYVGKSQDLVVEDYYRSGRMLLNMVRRVILDLTLEFSTFYRRRRRWAVWCLLAESSRGV